jgi:hypothetical protein
MLSIIGTYYYDTYKGGVWGFWITRTIGKLY